MVVGQFMGGVGDVVVWWLLDSIILVYLYITKVAP